jgi:hypothetical protein
MKPANKRLLVKLAGAAALLGMLIVAARVTGLTGLSKRCSWDGIHALPPGGCSGNYSA